MGESQLTAMKPEVCERLIDRLGLALETARTAVSLRDEVPAELELRGLSPAEFDVIKAWLEYQAQGRLAGAVTEPHVAAPAGRIVWLKDRQRPAPATGARSQTSR